MFCQIGLQCRLLERIACIIGVALLTLNAFPPNDPPPIFLPLIERSDEE
jgi:hypothetical protein